MSRLRRSNLTGAASTCTIRSSINNKMENAMRLILASAMLAASTLASFAAAPEGQKLSEIIAKVEQNAEVHYVDEVDWKSRRGYYEVEYIRKDGAKVKIRIDPKTGETVRGKH
jgi:uncharacterized membrane protein YkoI